MKRKNFKSIRNIKRVFSITDLQKIKGGSQQLKDAAVGVGLGSSSGG